jgi:hypothetical protein
MAENVPCDPDPLGLGLGLTFVLDFVVVSAFLLFAPCFLLFTPPAMPRNLFKNSTKIPKCFLLILWPFCGNFMQNKLIKK